MTYPLLRSLARLLLSIFYRRLEIVGLERVPPTGPLVVVANHQNALVDGALLVAAIPRRLVPVAKAPLFTHPIAGPLLRLVGAIPVHRRQDAPGETDPARNAEMFAEAAATLRRGAGILILPEGVSQPEPTLMPLRTGVARLVLGAERSAVTPLGITILPVGLVFDRPGTFRDGSALVLIGDPVPTASALARVEQDPEGAVRDLTDRVAAALRALMVEAHDRETLRLLDIAETLWREGAGELGSDSVAERAAWKRQTLRAARYLAAHAPARLAAVRLALRDYADDHEAVDVQAESYRPASAIRYVVREGLSLALGLPLAVWGLVNHVVPYQLTAVAGRALRPEPDIEATYKLGVGLLLYPLAWGAEGWLVWRVMGALGLAVFIVSLFPTGFFALAWQERLARVRRDVRAFVRFVRDRDLHRRLVDRRRALAHELRALADLVPEEILTGRNAP
jgi:1-acyl-sn-glycerol-3-phosphate acyltransferase